MFLKPKSITKMTPAKIRDATITNMAELWSCCHDGQLTLFTSSVYDSWRYNFILFIFFWLSVLAEEAFCFDRIVKNRRVTIGFAGAERFELPSTVLETAILPLNYAPR